MYGINHRLATALIALVVLFSTFVFIKDKNFIEQEKYYSKLIIFSYATPLLGVFAWFILSGKSLPWRELDNFFRLIFITPIFFLVARRGIDERLIFYGFVVGSIAIFISALMSVSYNPGRAVFTYFNPIPLGNMAGIYFLAILFYI